MTASMDRGSKEASPDARQDDDDAAWIETVLASLQSRSTEDRQALLKALLHGDTPTPKTHPVSGTIPSKMILTEGKSWHPPPVELSRLALALLGNVADMFSPQQ